MSPFRFHFYNPLDCFFLIINLFSASQSSWWRTRVVFGDHVLCGPRRLADPYLLQGKINKQTKKQNIKQTKKQTTIYIKLVYNKNNVPLYRFISLPYVLPNCFPYIMKDILYLRSKTTPHTQTLDDGSLLSTWKQKKNNNWWLYNTLNDDGIRCRSNLLCTILGKNELFSRDRFICALFFFIFKYSTINSCYPQQRVVLGIMLRGKTVVKQARQLERTVSILSGIAWKPALWSRYDSLRDIFAVRAGKEMRFGLFFLFFNGPLRAAFSCQRKGKRGVRDSRLTGRLELRNLPEKMRRVLVRNDNTANARAPLSACHLASAADAGAVMKDRIFNVLVIGRP